MQPLVLSPKVWMWKPRLALASLPVISQEMVVGADSDSCTRVTVPETLESPRTTATTGGRADVSELFTHSRGGLGSREGPEDDLQGKPQQRSSSRMMDGPMTARRGHQGA